jgi:hypothetical protein
MKARKIYLAGKVSGLTFIEAYQNFCDQDLQFAGRGTTINPMKKCHPNWSWIRCMIVCLYYLVFHCNRISLQPNWKQSKGAKIEVLIAIITRKEFI